MSTENQSSRTTRLAVSIEEAVIDTAVGRTTLYKAISTGDLVARKVGRRTIVMVADLEAWLMRLPHCQSRKVQS